MNTTKKLFFCAIGGSGMLPLAMMMKACGHEVIGSDRARDQARLPDRFAFIEKQGIQLFPQDGSGISKTVNQVVVSTAVEETVPDYQAAIDHKIPIIHRAALLAELVNKAQTGIGVAGTSGKSTTTGMIGWILSAAGENPSIVNGAVMKNFISADIPFASAVVGDPDLLVAEVDESDGSIEKFSPTIAVLNNIAIDHKTLDELRVLFDGFIDRAERCIINLDNTETATLAARKPADRVITYSLEKDSAILFARNIELAAETATFDVLYQKDQETAHVSLPVTGRHNISNALAAIGASIAAGVPFPEACAALAGFKSIARRMDVIGTAKGVTVIDDFAHNPDKIAAALRTFHQVDGRLIILFQPHGYGPLALMKEAFIASFTKNLGEQDVLFLCDPLYLGGTTERTVTSADIAQGIAMHELDAKHLPKREDCAAAIIKMAEAGDRVIVMGARDDSLNELAQEILFHIGIKQEG